MIHPRRGQSRRLLDRVPADRIKADAPRFEANPVKWVKKRGESDNFGSRIPCLQHRPDLLLLDSVARGCRHHRDQCGDRGIDFEIPDFEVEEADVLRGPAGLARRGGDFLLSEDAENLARSVAFGDKRHRTDAMTFMIPSKRGARLDAYIPSGSDPHTSLSHDPIVAWRRLRSSGLRPEVGMLGRGSRPQRGRESGDLKSAVFLENEPATIE